jgi:hypothetical protein
VLVLAGAGLPAQTPKLTLDLVVDRMMAYTDAYPHALGRVVAQERYDQQLRARPREPGGGSHERVETRVTMADVGFAPLGREWVAIRDVYEVDGVPVPDAGRRLERALAQPDAESAIRAILRDNARFNLDDARIGRNINVPTIAVQFLQSRHRWRFSFDRDGEETLGGQRLWRIRFRERERPTLVRQQNGRDQPLRGAVWVDPSTGRIFQTDLRWDRGPAGHILVTYGRVERIASLVPLTMSEEYIDTEDGNAMRIRAEAVYSNFRQFTTSGRLVTPQ